MCLRFSQIGYRSDILCMTILSVRKAAESFLLCPARSGYLPRGWLRADMAVLTQAPRFPDLAKSQRSLPVRGLGKADGCLQGLARL